MIYGVSDKMSRNTNYRAWGSVGHYLQGPGLLEEIESYTSGFGTKHFYIIDVFFFDTWTQKLAEIYENSKVPFKVPYLKERLPEVRSGNSRNRQWEVTLIR